MFRAGSHRPFFLELVVNFNVTSNIDDVLGYTARIHPQFSFAHASGLTRTAMKVRDAEKQAMPSAFDRPTRWTINSLYLRGATKSRQQADVWFKDTGDGASGEYLKPQVFGGLRPQKRFEKRLQAAGIMPPGWVAVPGKGVKLDAYGNMSSQQIVQLLSVLRAQLDPQQNTTDRSRDRARRKGKSRDYFVSGPRVAAPAPNGGRLPFGVYQRLSGRVMSILLFVPQAKYSQRFDFFGIANTTARAAYPVEAREAWRKALASARR